MLTGTLITLSPPYDDGPFFEMRAHTKLDLSFFNNHKSWRKYVN